MICALRKAFVAYHSRAVTIVLRRGLAAIPEMFGVPYVVDDDLIERAERNEAFRGSYDNRLFASPTFYAHPSFERSAVRVDQLTARERMSQADMYRMMLRLPPRSPLTRPPLPWTGPLADRVLVLPEATSWPARQPGFWDRLVTALRADGRDVEVNRPEWTLSDLLRECARSSWVIGPQCGVISIVVAGQFRGRKTIVSASLDGNSNPYPGYWADRTYPYGYVTKFDGEDYDVEERKVGDGDHDAVVAAILSGPNALATQPHDPTPRASVAMALTPGELLDRLAILTVKRERFDPPRRAAVEREYLRHLEAKLRFDAETRAPTDVLFRALLEVHRRAYDVLAEVVPGALGEAPSPPRSAYEEAVRLNRERVRLRAKIDEYCGAPYAEVKDYYG